MRLNARFDKSYNFSKQKLTARKVLGMILKYLLVSVSLSIVLYFILSSFIYTDQEKKLRDENANYEALYPELLARTELLGDVIAGLQIKDSTIYHEIFHAQAPPVDPVTRLDMFWGSTDIPQEKLEKYAGKKVQGLLDRAAAVDSLLLAIDRDIRRPGAVIPPMSLPLNDVEYLQFGATTGTKMSPILKAYVHHGGLDIMAPQETPVYAPADGVVTNVVRSFRGTGNSIEITHAGGYVTRYMHLSATYVNRGQRVVRGKRIGSVGMTGNSMVPHLHYEMQRDSLELDPLGFIMANTSPLEYANILFMAAHTDQSLD